MELDFSEVENLTWRVFVQEIFEAEMILSIIRVVYVELGAIYVF